MLGGGKGSCVGLAEAISCGLIAVVQKQAM